MKKLHLNNKGFALAFSLIFVFLIVIFAEIYITVANSGLTLSTQAADSKRAYYLADAGLANAMVSLRSYASPPAASLLTLSNNSYMTFNGKTGGYSVSATSDGAAWPTYTITSVGTFGALSKTLQLTVKEASFSKFAYASNSENHPVYGNLYWVNGMVTAGPVHTNGSFNMFGDPITKIGPIFNGAVSQFGSAVNYYHGSAAADYVKFNAGLTTSAPKVSWPTTALINSVNSYASAADGLLLTGNTAVTFNANGTINVTNAAKGWSNLNMSPPANKTIYVQGGSATVRGTVNGQLTVGSENNIYIDGHISYNSDPRLNPASTDLLGLVAKQDITVTMAAPNNLAVNAVLVALNGSFQVDQFWVGTRGNMDQFGGLINNVGGPTGIFDPATGILYAGYNQIQAYDTRLHDYVPPAFPPATDTSSRITYTKLNLLELN